MQMREKVGRSRNTVFFQWFGAPEGRKSRLAKAAGAEPAGQMRDEKLHAVVARSTFASQNVQNTWCSEHFWKLRCRKSARRCGAKHICKSKCTKHLVLGALLEVEMSKKCAPLWHKAHFQVKMYKTPQRRTTFGSYDVEKVHVVVARSTFRSQNVKNTRGSDHFWTLRPRKSARRCGAKHMSKSKVQKTEGYGALLDVQMSFCGVGARDCAPRQKWAKRAGFVAFSTTTTTTPHYTPIHYTTLQLQLHLHYIPLHSTTFHYITLHYTHYTPLHSTTLHSITLNYTQLYSITLHYITLHSTTLHYITLHYLPLHYTTLRYTTLHYTTLHCTTLHCLPLHFTTLHYTTLHSTLHPTALHYTDWHCTTDREVDR